MIGVNFYAFLVHDYTGLVDKKHTNNREIKNLLCREESQKQQSNNKNLAY